MADPEESFIKLLHLARARVCQETISTITKGMLKCDGAKYKIANVVTDFKSAFDEKVTMDINEWLDSENFKKFHMLLATFRTEVDDEKKEAIHLIQSFFMKTTTVLADTKHLVCVFSALLELPGKYNTNTVIQRYTTSLDGIWILFKKLNIVNNITAAAMVNKNASYNFHVYGCGGVWKTEEGDGGRYNEIKPNSKVRELLQTMLHLIAYLHINFWKQLVLAVNNPIPIGAVAQINKLRETHAHHISLVWNYHKYMIFHEVLYSFLYVAFPFTNNNKPLLIEYSIMFNEFRNAAKHTEQIRNHINNKFKKLANKDMEEAMKNYVVLVAFNQNPVLLERKVDNILTKSNRAFNREIGCRYLAYAVIAYYKDNKNTNMQFDGNVSSFVDLYHIDLKRDKEGVLTFFKNWENLLPTLCQNPLICINFYDCLFNDINKKEDSVKVYYGMDMLLRHCASASFIPDFIPPK